MISILRNGHIFQAHLSARPGTTFLEKEPRNYAAEKITKTQDTLIEATEKLNETLASRGFFKTNKIIEDSSLPETLNLPQQSGKLSLLKLTNPSLKLTIKNKNDSQQIFSMNLMLGHFVSPKNSEIYLDDNLQPYSVMLYSFNCFPRGLTDVNSGFITVNHCENPQHHFHVKDIENGKLALEATKNEYLLPGGICVPNFNLLTAEEKTDINLPDKNKQLIKNSLKKYASCLQFIQTFALALKPEKSGEIPKLFGGQNSKSQT